MPFVTHVRCGTPIELRGAPRPGLTPITMPWCPGCDHFVDLDTLSSTGPFSAVVAGDAPVYLHGDPTHDPHHER